MKLLFYKLMMLICFGLESIHDSFSIDKSLFYPSLKWEILYRDELEKKAGGKNGDADFRII